ncbi:MAG: hypothetical protein SFU83_02420 [Meiothermus sp.]|nr:hypothetical protein [Meiothermus sp.]
MSPDAAADARRTLVWSALLALAILSLVVLMLSAVTLVQLLPHAARLTNETGIVTLPSGMKANADLFRVSVPAFALSLGLAAASVWGLLWFKKQWAAEPVAAKSAKPGKAAQAKPGKAAPKSSQGGKKKRRK